LCGHRDTEKGKKKAQEATHGVENAENAETLKSEQFAKPGYDYVSSWRRRSTQTVEIRSI
jgi:hypothetical protein